MPRTPRLSPPPATISSASSSASTPPRRVPAFGFAVRAATAPTTHCHPPVRLRCRCFLQHGGKYDCDSPLLERSNTTTSTAKVLPQRPAVRTTTPPPPPLPKALPSARITTPTLLPRKNLRSSSPLLLVSRSLPPLPMPSGASSTPRVAGPQLSAPLHTHGNGNGNSASSAPSASISQGAATTTAAAATPSTGGSKGVADYGGANISWDAIAGPALGADGMGARVNAKDMSLPQLCARMHERLAEFLAVEAEEGSRMKAVQMQVRNSLGVIREALGRYSLEELSLSYNGGKDCLVLLILYLSALHLHYGSSTQPSTDSTNSTNSLSPTNDTNNTNNSNSPPSTSLPKSLEAVYIISPHPFPEIDAFVDTSESHYHLSLSRYAQPMKQAFTSYLADRPRVRAIFVGTRRTDPHGADLTPFLPTDGGWPAFMRVHPMLEWRYAEIWTFIKGLGIPYCALYDLGYTSLGGTTDTFPNPVLKRSNTTDGASAAGRGDGGKDGVVDGAREEQVFRPAYELLTDEEERWGRS